MAVTRVYMLVCEILKMCYDEMRNCPVGENELAETIVEKIKAFLEE